VIEPNPAKPIYSIVVGTDRDLVSIGGYSGTGETVTPLGNVAAFDLGQGTWRDLASMPFDPPLLSPGAVWTGNEVIVLGNPCGPTRLGDVALDCKEATLQAAALTVSSNTWKEITVPDAVKRATKPYAFTVKGIGWTGTEALFTVVQDLESPAKGYWLYNPATDEWRSAPDPDAGAEVTCLQDRTLFAARVGAFDPETGIRDSSMGAAEGQISAWELELNGDPRWVALAQTPKPLPAIDTDGVWCIGGNMLVYMANGVGTSEMTTLWFEPTKGSWERLPNLGAMSSDSGGAEVDGTRVIWPPAGDNAFVLRPGAAAWSSLSRPIEVQLPAHRSGIVGGQVFTDMRVRGGTDQLAVVAP
jgi:hypothetical protein